MAETTEISWAHSTFNPWIGCTKVSPGCDHCYAATLMDDRYGRVKWGAGEARSRTKTWGQPVRWNKLAAASGKPWRVFCASLADVFDNEVPDEWRTDLWALIAATPHLTWMLLTKRIGNVTYPMPHNVWLGITVVNQEEYDRDGPKLMRADARLRFLSCEPLLGPIRLRRPSVDWVIVGGESGKGAREFDPAWARSLRDQCRADGMACFVKQVGARPQEIAYPGGVTEGEAKRWQADGWTRITMTDGAEHWRRYWKIKDRAGAEPAEWPADLRVQEFPR